MPLLVCGFAQTVYFAKSKHVHSAFARILQIWNGSLFSLSLATNVTVTLLIALRVWYILRDFGRKKYFPFFKVMLVIIESGMIYSVALICEITLYFLTLNAFYIVYDPIAQLTVSYTLSGPAFAAKLHASGLLDCVLVYVIDMIDARN